MPSKEQQVREVVEGMALGLVTLGVTRVSSSKLDLEFAFSYAWRRWSHADEYPSIGRATKPDNEFYRGVLKSERRRDAVVVWKSDGREYELGITLDRWTASEAAQQVSVRPLGQWEALAEPFRQRLDGRG